MRRAIVLIRTLAASIGRSRFFRKNTRPSCWKKTAAIGCISNAPMRLMQTSQPSLNITLVTAARKV